MSGAPGASDSSNPGFRKSMRSRLTASSPKRRLPQRDFRSAPIRKDETDEGVWLGGSMACCLFCALLRASHGNQSGCTHPIRRHRHGPGILVLSGRHLKIAKIRSGGVSILFVKNRGRGPFGAARPHWIVTPPLPFEMPRPYLRATAFSNSLESTLILRASRGLLVQICKPGRRQLRVADRVLNVPVPEIPLDAAGIDAAVRQIVPAGMPAAYEGERSAPIVPPPWQRC